MKPSLYGAGAEYALHSLSLLMARSEPASVRDLARFQGLPERFLAKLFVRLQKAGLVQAAEGVAGGYMLARAPEQISVLDVLTAVDPGRVLFACSEIRRNCTLFDGKPPTWSTAGMCGIHRFMREAEQELRNNLAATSLEELNRGFREIAPKNFIAASALWFESSKQNRRKSSRKSNT